MELGVLRLSVELRNYEFWGCACGAMELGIFGDASGVWIFLLGVAFRVALWNFLARTEHDFIF